MRSGLALTHTVSFASGFPDANVVWRVLDSAGFQKATGTITPQNGDVSVDITVNAADNTLPGGTLYSVRDLVWTYQVGGKTVEDEERYILESRVPFGARPDGVRNKLGLGSVDLGDDEIELMKAYLWFENDVGETRLATFLTGTPVQQMKIADAIEASAGLDLLPSLQVRVAKSESSGTNQFQRDKIDWTALELRLNRYVDDAHALVDPSFVTDGVQGSLFLLSTPLTDPLTGNAN